MARKFIKASAYKKGHNYVPVTHESIDENGDVLIIEGYGDSQTKPRQGYSNKQLVDMHKRGVNPEIMRKAIYEMDVFGTDINPLRKKGLDYTDMDTVLEQIKNAEQAWEVHKKKSDVQRKEAKVQELYEEFKDKYEREHKLGKYKDSQPDN